MNSIPVHFLAPLYIGGGLVVLHSLTWIMGFGYQPGVGRPLVGRGGLNLAFSSIAAGYEVCLAVLAYGAMGAIGTWQRLPALSVELRSWSAGLGVLVLATALRRALLRLEKEAQANRLRGLVGLRGEVKEPIPPRGKGTGVVVMKVRMKEMAIPAIAKGDVEIPAGQQVLVTAFREPNMLEVKTEADFREAWRSFAGES